MDWKLAPEHEEHWESDDELCDEDGVLYVDDLDGIVLCGERVRRTGTWS